MMSDEVQTNTWRKQVSLPQTMTNCVHIWEDNSPVPRGYEKCTLCKEQTNPRMRAHCRGCLLTTCPMCSRFCLGRKLIIQKSNITPYDNKDTLISELLEYTEYLLAENQKLKEKIQKYELNQEMAELEKEALRKGKFQAKEESEKKTWMTFPAEYEELTNIADDPTEDPVMGSKEEQDRAYNDLERLSCHNVKDLFDYMNDYKVLAAKSGRVYISPELSEKFFRKMPPLIGKELEKAFAKKYPGNPLGIFPRMHFAYQFLTEQRKHADLQRSLEDLSVHFLKEK